jgi:hypothetical protein
MPKVTIPIHSFQFGELSPAFTSRVDTKLYQACGQKVRNFSVLNEGSIRKRPGTEFIYQFSNTYDSSAGLQVRIEPFAFSDTEGYIFAFSNNKLDIFTINPSTNAVSYTTSITGASNCPWTTAKIPELTMASIGDIMVVCHGSFNPKIIRRTAADTFSTEEFAFENKGVDDSPAQPYYQFQKSGVTLDPSATSGTGVTVTASESYFVSDHVGSYLLINDTPCEIKSYVSGTEVTVDITGTIQRTLIPNSIEVFDGSSTVRVTMPLHGMSAGDSFTILRIGDIGGKSANQVEGTFSVATVVDLNTFEYSTSVSASSSEIGGGSVTVASHAPTLNFYEQSYSEVRGYPGAVVFHEGRLWFGGTEAQPDHVWASKSGNFFNFDVGEGADSDAIDLSNNFGEFSRIRHLVSNRDLQIFAASSESFIPAFTSRPITPSNALIRRQTGFGSSFVKPAVVDGATVYTQISGKIIGSYLYDDNEAAYNTSNISIVAAHLINTPTQAATLSGVFDSSETYYFTVNQDGTLPIFYSARSDQKAGWMQWEMGNSGEFHSVCVIDNRVFCVSVVDEGDGTDRLYLQEFKQSIPMDFCKEFTGTAGVFDVSSVFSNGATVKVVSGNDFIGEFTVASGQVDVSAVKEITTAYIGYAFDLLYETMPVDILISGDSMTGKPRKIDMVTLNLVDTLSVSVNDKDLIIRNVNDDFSLDRTAFTGQKEFRIIGFSRNPTVQIKQSVPFDVQVNGMVIEVSY